MDNFKSGKYRKHSQDKVSEYEYFLPNKINKNFNWIDDEISTLLESAASFLADLNSYAVQTPDIDFFIKMHVAKEATTSSRIEGIKTEIEEVFMSEDEIIPEKRDDWEEVKNYIKAMNYSIDELNNLPLSIRLIKNTHKILLSGVRGERKMPGEIRKSQNWIGGNNIKNASFIPPHFNHLDDLLSDLEKFWHNKELNVPHLIKAGVSHYQFETIHPFLDGNGRIGRLLITLYLIDKKVINKPVLYLSNYFEKNRNQYFNLLTRVREENDITAWLKFFLKGVIQVSKEGVSTLKSVVNLKEEYIKTINDNISSRRKEIAKKALMYLFSNPHVSIDDVSKEIDVTFPTASTLIKKLEENNIVKEVSERKRDKRYQLIGYIEIFKS